MPAMAVKKLSVALDEQVAGAAAKSAERQGLSLSAWLNRAAENALAVEDGLAAVAEWEAEHGALTEEELAAADAALVSTFSCYGLDFSQRTTRGYFATSFE